MQPINYKTDNCFDGREIANFVLDRCKSKGRDVTNLSLQKIIYFCHVWSMIDMGRPLIKIKFEAWQHGPVLQHIYNQFKEFDERPISARATKLDPITGKQVIVKYEFDSETEKLLIKIIDFYSQLSASQLRELSHTKGGPWEKAWNHDGNVNPGMKIDNRDIKNFYLKSNSSLSQSVM